MPACKVLNDLVPGERPAGLHSNHSFLLWKVVLDRRGEWGILNGYRGDQRGGPLLRHGQGCKRFTERRESDEEEE